MATWLVGHTPWLLPVRARIRLDVLPSRLWLQARSHLNNALQSPSPASLEIETMPYPTTRPDPSVFESMSEEYASVATLSAFQFTPLNSSETLASLVLEGNFQVAESLRKEMISHHIPIPHNVLYLRAALHAIRERRPKGSAKKRLNTFEAWLSLAPDRHEQWQSFIDIRQRLFWSMDHLNLRLVYRFGLILASKGYYSGSAALQAMSTLARYAQPSVVERYLREVEDATRDYHLKEGMHPSSGLLTRAYSISIRTAALGGKDQAAFDLISMAQSHGIRVPDFTLDIVAKHALDQQLALDRIRAFYPSWTMKELNTIESKVICTERSDDVAVLATRLRSLRSALRSPTPPSPRALRSFITSYRALGRTRALTLLQSLAHRHSPKSASTWVFTKMLHHRSRREPIRLLLVFSRYFHPVGVPRKTLFSLIRGTRSRRTRKERVRLRVVAPRPMNTKLWPSAYHTALVWEAIVMLSPRVEKDRLYALLLSLVQRSRILDGPDARQHPEADQPRLQLPPDAFDAAHFSPFVMSWSRHSPAKAASVLEDMTHLGIEPSMIQWSMVARGYAQHDDPLVASRILDRLEETERGKTNSAKNGDGGGTVGPSDLLLGAHTNVLRGLVIAGDVHHAREVERRLVERMGYRAGDRRATDMSIAFLRDLEDRLSVS